VGVTSGGDRPTHEAAASAVGYLYQVQVALVELLYRSRRVPDAAMTIERLDDIAFEENGSPVELLQTKHHVDRQARLTDAGADLWRTLGVWTDAVATRTIDPRTTTLTLLTTADAAPGSIASWLRSTERDSRTALASLERTARTSISADQRAIYGRFLALSPDDRKALVEAIVVLDGSDRADDLDWRLFAELKRTTEPRLVPALAERLLGWWYERAVRHLLYPDQGPIFGEEVEQKIADLRDQFASENLPIDQPDEAGLALLNADDRIFVAQLQLIAANDTLLELAIRDYKRAYQQKARWVRDGLVFGDELARYERRLEDEWRNRHAFMQQRREADASDTDLERAGMNLYESVQAMPTWIRPRVEYPFVVRGSLHKLADELRIGWHPEFVARLRHLLEQTA
jgi:hypothetical protein